MPPPLALFIWLVLLLALWFNDPARDNRSSWAIWIPLVWIFFVASRLPAQWIGANAGLAADVFQEGNALDRAVFLALTFLAVGVLAVRGFAVGPFVARNVFWAAFLLFALISALWSDYQFTALKRWVRDVGSYAAILVVLTETDPRTAVRTVLRRLFYLTIPLSIIFVKYYPHLGRSYSEWTGAASYQGVTTSKNMLGVLCLLCVLFFLWDLLMRYPRRAEPQTRRVLWVNVGFIAMGLWLLRLANSATSLLCLVLGAMLVLGAHTGWLSRHPRVLKVTPPLLPVVFLLLSLGFSLNSTIATVMGRDATFTDRTEIWGIVLQMSTNPLLGSGYETFWLGDRLQNAWRHFRGLTNAHNGYLELYLNLGLIGLVLLVGFLALVYKQTGVAFERDPRGTSLQLALWTILIFYNVTEAAFRVQLLWLTFLLTTAAFCYSFGPVVELAGSPNPSHPGFQKRLGGVQPGRFREARPDPRGSGQPVPLPVKAPHRRQFIHRAAAKSQTSERS